MNTPKTMKRWGTTEHKSHQLPGPAYFGITEQETALAYAQAISYWPHLEEVMIDLFGELLTGDPDRPADPLYSGRQIFRTIINASTRINVMRTLLEKTPVNSNKPALFDEILDEYNRLNTVRNDYVHGLWWTTEGRVMLAKPTTEYSWHSEPREVSANELALFLAEMRALHDKTNMRHGKPRGT